MKPESLHWTVKAAISFAMGVAAIWLALFGDALSILTLPVMALLLLCAERETNRFGSAIYILPFFMAMIVVAWPASFDYILSVSMFHWLAAGVALLISLVIMIVGVISLPFIAIMALRINDWLIFPILTGCTAVPAHLLMLLLLDGVPSPVPAYFIVHPFSELSDLLYLPLFASGVMTGLMTRAFAMGKQGALPVVAAVAISQLVPVTPARILDAGSVISAAGLKVQGLRYVGQSYRPDVDIYVYPESSIPGLARGDKLPPMLPKKGYVIIGGQQTVDGIEHESIMFAHDGVVQAVREKSLYVYGEYSSFVSWLQKWKKNRIYQWDGHAVVSLNGVSIPVDALLCVESLHPDFVRKHAKGQLAFVSANQARFNLGWMPAYTRKMIALSSQAANIPVVRSDWDSVIVAYPGNYPRLTLVVVMLMFLSIVGFLLSRHSLNAEPFFPESSETKMLNEKRSMS